MNSKKITIVTNYKSVAEHHKEALETLFLDGVAVSTLSFDFDEINSYIDADVLLISLYSIYVEIKKYVSENTKVVILGTTITESQYQKVNAIAKTSQVLLVNYSPEMTFETLALFRQVGLTEYDFIPYYPGKPKAAHVEIAVTPGESDKVPESVKKIIDIGHRTLDIQTITDVAVEIGREDVLHSNRCIKHFKSLKKASNSVSVLLDKANIIESQFLKLLNVIDEGIIATGTDGTIFAMNDKALEILGATSKRIGENILMSLKHPYVEKAIFEKVSLENEMIEINHNYISLKAVSVQLGDMVNSILFVLNKFEEKEKRQHELRTQILGKGHVAKYTFDDILGKCSAIQEVRKKGIKMAKSDSAILITGESGTGKELLAQAIHNASKRKEYQFVAINCAAIPESLLESELFGYEEGAFTGAKKGGKMGLFELAHKGTLFLDEVGEMPIQLQSRLLRVIQEKEVMRIGGDHIIYVDVRIVAATNKNLKQLVNKNRFRNDLYYRLKVLSMKLPPLRERGDDILYLFDSMLRDIRAQYVASKEARAYLKSYGWEGNIRELRNCVEYLAHLEKEVIDVEDLELHFEDELTLDRPVVYSPVDCRTFVLGCLYQSRQKLKGIGRRKIMTMAKEFNVFITETDVRKCLRELADEGLVEMSSGRGGSRLTEEGFKVASSVAK